MTAPMLGSDKLLGYEILLLVARFLSFIMEQLSDHLGCKNVDL